MVIYPRYRLYPITPDTPIDPNNQHIIFSNIPFYQVISPLYPQLNHHGCFCGWVFTILPCFFVWLHRWIPYTTILPGGILRTFPYSPWILHIFPIFFCIVLVFKYIYINIILFLLHFPYIPWSYHIFHIYIYTYSPYISHPAFLQAIHQPHLQGSTVAGHPSFVPRGHLRSEVPSLCPAAFLGREETPCAGRWSLDCRISMKMVPHQPSFMTCISIFIICSFFQGVWDYLWFVIFLRVFFLLF